MADISKEMALKIAREAGDYADKHHEHHGGWLEAESYYFAQACFKLGRNAGLEEAKQHCIEAGTPQPNEIHTDAQWAAKVLATQIESLKDNTP